MGGVSPHCIGPRADCVGWCRWMSGGARPVAVHHGERSVGGARHRRITRSDAVEAPPAGGPRIVPVPQVPDPADRRAQRSALCRRLLPGAAYLLAAVKTYVIAIAGAADEDHVRRLGADEVIDYLTADVVAETLRRYRDGVDAVVNIPCRPTA